MSGDTAALCQSCHAVIVWAPSAATGKAMPLDQDPDPTGNVMLNADGEAVVLSGQALLDARVGGLELRWPHHATCPQGRAWKGASRRGPRR